MNVTGTESIVLYGDNCEPVSVIDIPEMLKDGYTVISLEYSRHQEILGCSGYTLTPEGDIYQVNITPVSDPEGSIIPDRWNEDILEKEDLKDILTRPHNYTEWYATDSSEITESLDGPAICDFVDAWLKMNPGYYTDSDEDFIEEEY